MKLSRLIGRTIKESPRDAELPSHKYLLRAGYARQYSAGIYGLLPLGQRSLQKIEKIIREEMDAVEGQEVKMPCMMTKELWDESGRYSSIDKIMFRLTDRGEKPMVLGVTHEEAAVALARTELTSYRQLPTMLYQIQSKFRDEPRPRGGLVRLREFLMKDAYSFHASEECLKTYYGRVHEAYLRIFQRAGCRNFCSVLSDNGMFGGKFSHEFMMLVPTGEDTLITCNSCDYKANQEIAATRFSALTDELRPLEKVSTPGQKTIAELCQFLGVVPQKTAKAVMFGTAQGELVVAFIRGDLEINEAKLKSFVQSELQPATTPLIREAGAAEGSTGPKGLNHWKARVIIDRSLEKNSNVVTGANEDDFHYLNFNFERDLFSTLSDIERRRVSFADISTVKAGDSCPQCEGQLQESRGIEIGNIFHLGTRYSESMGATYLDSNGEAQNPIMGCYGIGVTRLLPSIIEESHDKFGMILPLPVAPYEVHLCALNYTEAPIKESADTLYKALMRDGMEVLMDDRDEKPGSQFADADLIGIPFRLILSKKTLASESVELKYRDGRSPPRLIKLTEISAVLKRELEEEYQKYKPVS